MSESYPKLITEDASKRFAVSVNADDNVFVVQSSFKMQIFMIFLSIFQSTFGLIFLGGGSVYVGLSLTYQTEAVGLTYLLRFGIFGIFLSILCLFTGFIGLGALWQPTSHQSLMMTYFIFLITSTVGCGIAAFFATDYLCFASSKYRTRIIPSNYDTLFPAATIGILVAAFLQFLLGIISSAFVSYNWTGCCNGKPPQNRMIYYQNKNCEATPLLNSD